jgi:hypothetical protein
MIFFQHYVKLCPASDIPRLQEIFSRGTLALLPATNCWNRVYHPLFERLFPLFERLLRSPGGRNLKYYTESTVPESHRRADAQHNRLFSLHCRRAQTRRRLRAARVLNSPNRQYRMPQIPPHPASRNHAHHSEKKHENRHFENQSETNDDR